jgi:hypothetical protein
MHRQYRVTSASCRPVLGVGLALLVLVLGALASGAAVYHAIHHVASSHASDCAVCSFAQSQVAAADAAVEARPPAAPVVAAAISPAGFVWSHPSFVLPPGRAPPVLSVIS